MASTDQPPSSPSPDAGEPSESPWRVAPVTIRSTALAGILLLMVMYTLYLAAPLFMPLTVAFLTGLMFGPAVQWVKKLGIPPPITAAVVLLALLGIGIGAVYALSWPASEWVDRAPREMQRIEYKLQGFMASFENLKETKESIEEATTGGSGGDSDNESELRWSPIQWVMTSTWNVIYGLGVGIIFLYFQLASGDLFLRKLVRVLPHYEDKRIAVETVHRIQRSIATFLGTITIVNICLGAAAVAIFYAIGLPNPLLFGVMVGLFNFAPYVGPLISLVILLFVSLIAFDTVGQILLAPGLTLALNVLEGQFITPTLAGRRLALSPLAVFVSITVWGWMWGIVGLLVAVPLVASIKLVCERIEPLRPIAEFLGQ